jgi:hypothetical protein
MHQPTDEELRDQHELVQQWRQLHGTCPRCGQLATEIIREIGQATQYWPCGHQDLLADLRVTDI